MHTFTLSELAKKLRAKEFSVTELTKCLLARIEASQPTLNAFITVTAESALAQAKAADAALWRPATRARSRACRSRTRTSSAPQGVKTSCGSQHARQLRVAI